MTDVTTVSDLIDRWNSPDGHPYRGELIDWEAYAANPADVGCMCAQGQALHLLAGWSPERLNDADQADADRASAELLGISVAHAILLRRVNDTTAGAPAVVLTHPERVIGDQAPTILAFWRHLDGMNREDWAAARAAARAAAWDAAWDAARAAAAYATAEIMGAAVMRDRGQSFHFLPLLGFADPEAVLAAVRPVLA